VPAPDDRLARVAFAKNPEHERFVQGFAGRTRGRYALAYLVGVEILAGSDLRKSIEAELGNPVYLPAELCDGRDLAVICDRALRAGVSMTRLGELVIPSYKRANPKAFEGKTVTEAFGNLRDPREGLPRGLGLLRRPGVAGSRHRAGPRRPLPARPPDAMRHVRGNAARPAEGVRDRGQRPRDRMPLGRAALLHLRGGLDLSLACPQHHPHPVARP
jgi:hypothetical protein